MKEFLTLLFIMFVAAIAGGVAMSLWLLTGSSTIGLVTFMSVVAIMFWKKRNF